MTQSKWKSIYKLGGLAALGTVLVGIAESVIQGFPVSNMPLETVTDWFALLQSNPFIGLRNLGLLNIFLNILSVPIYLALYAAHRKLHLQPYAALATIVSFLGVGVFFATNRAFPMLTLSQQYAAATNDAQRAALEAAGEAMLSVGASHSSGTFFAFFFAELAAIIISIVMLRGEVFGKVASYAGMLGFGILLILEFPTAFGGGLSDVTIIFFMLAGLFSLAWSVLIAWKLFQLGKSDEKI
jgi:hypothetical protein